MIKEYPLTGTDTLILGTNLNTLAEFGLRRIRLNSRNFYKKEYYTELKNTGYSFCDVHAGNGINYYLYLIKEKDFNDKIIISKPSKYENVIVSKHSHKLLKHAIKKELINSVEDAILFLDTVHVFKTKTFRLKKVITHFGDRYAYYLI